MYPYPHFTFCEPLWTQRSWDGVISMTRLWADLSDVRIVGKARYLFLSRKVQTRSGAHTAFYSYVYCGSLPGMNWLRHEVDSHVHLVPRLRRVEPYLSPSVCLCGVDRDKFTHCCHCHCCIIIISGLKGVSAISTEYMWHSPYGKMLLVVSWQWCNAWPYSKECRVFFL